MSCFDSWSNPLTFFTETIFGNRTASPRFAAIDGLRALSYLWILIDHGVTNSSYYVEVYSTPLLLDKFIDFSFQGVTCFFVLSGFLVAYILTSAVDKNNLHNKNKYGGLTLEIFTVFLSKRFFRIAPAFYFSVLVTNLSLRFDRSYDDLNFALNWPSYIVFINNYFSGSLFWSVAVEMQFYLISALPMYLYLSKPLYGFIASGFMIAIPFLIRTIFSVNYENDNVSFLSSTYFNTITRADAYGVGMLVFMIWEAYMKDRPSSLSSEYYQNTNTHQSSIKATMLLIWVLIFVSVASMFLFASYDPPDYWPYSTTMFTNISYLSFACGSGSLILISLDGYISPINYILSSSVWIPFAGISYTGYLSSALTTGLYCNFVTVVLQFRKIDELGGIYFLIIQLICINFIFSILITVFIEKPFINIGAKLFDKN